MSTSSRTRRRPADRRVGAQRRRRNGHMASGDAGRLTVGSERRIGADGRRWGLPRAAQLVAGGLVLATTFASIGAARSAAAPSRAVSTQRGATEAEAVPDAPGPTLVPSVLLGVSYATVTVPVPAGATAMGVQVTGGSGGNSTGGDESGNGGTGAEVSGTIAVDATTVITVDVGDQGGHYGTNPQNNHGGWGGATMGGGAGGVNTTEGDGGAGGGGGGGASSLVINGQPAIIAGGGGGGGVGTTAGFDGGDGGEGGVSGEDGGDGGDGRCTFHGHGGDEGAAPTGQGTAGGVGNPNADWPAGGGGGGLLGGAGGTTGGECSSGGGAGTSYSDPTLVSSGTTATAPSRSAGSVEINWIFGTTFSSVTPRRLVDTRPDYPDGLRAVTKAKLVPGAVLAVRVTDVDGAVPAGGVGAVALNVTVTNPDGDGWIRVDPCDGGSDVSNVNYTSGQTISNSVLTAVSAAGTVCLTSYAPTDVVLDLDGWMPTGVFSPVTPRRLVDTRPDYPDGARTVAKTKLAPGAPMVVRVTDLAGPVPATGVGAVALNVTVTNPDGDGWIRVTPCGGGTDVSNVNYGSGQTISNTVLAAVSPSGTVCLTSYVPTDVIIDLEGWMPIGVYSSVTPRRLVDTRPEYPDGLRAVTKAKLNPGTLLTVHVSDAEGAVPASGVGAAALNITVTNPDGEGWIQVTPCGRSTDVSSVNFSSGQTISNTVLTGVSASGTVCLTSYAPTDVIIDLDGWMPG